MPAPRTPSSTGIGTTIYVEGMSDLIRKLRSFNPIAKRASKGKMEKWGAVKAEEVKERIRNAPRVDTGELWQGIHYKVTQTMDGYQVVVSPSEKGSRYAVFVEKDTRPHWPPRAALEPWAERHGIPVFLVQRSIATKGTKGIHMFELELKEAIPEARDLANAIGKEIVIQMNWGR
jgi:hypothetical protein